MRAHAGVRNLFSIAAKTRASDLGPSSEQHSQLLLEICRCRHGLRRRLGVSALDGVEETGELFIHLDQSCGSASARSCLNTGERRIESNQRIRDFLRFGSFALRSQQSALRAQLAERREVSADRVVHSHTDVVLNAKAGWGASNSWIHSYSQRLLVPAAVDAKPYRVGAGQDRRAKGKSRGVSGNRGDRIIVRQDSRWRAVHVTKKAMRAGARR